METTHGKTHSENGEGECWWSRIASPDAFFFFINHHDGYVFDYLICVVATSSSAAMHCSSEWLLFQR
jgi:hypothetical protein